MRLARLRLGRTAIVATGPLVAASWLLLAASGNDTRNAWAQRTTLTTADDDAGDGGGDASATAPRRRQDDDLVRMAQGLLDNKELQRMGTNLLDPPKPAAAKPRPPPRVNGAIATAPVPVMGAPGVVMGPAGVPVFIGGDAGDDASALATLDLPEAGVDASTPDAADDAGSDAGPDASTPDAAAVAAAEIAEKEKADPAATGSRRGGPGGPTPPKKAPPGNPELQGAAESPIAALGVPVKAVPAVATVATAGVMALWPAILKVLTGLFKSFLGAKFKDRGKQREKFDPDMRTYNVLGLPIRPVELRAILLAALVYGLAVCYAFQGKRMERGFVLSQEGLVLAIYYARALVRFVYERRYKLSTQYRFWFGGGILCLASAYMGNTLGTVGFELEGPARPEDKNRGVKMKVVLIVVAVVFAVIFFALNKRAPSKMLQSGRVMMAGAALAEILPISPMPGKKIFDWQKSAWAVLAALVVSVYVLTNFVF